MKHSVIAVLCVFLTLLGQAHDHSHEGHDHSHESHDHSHEDHDHSHDHKHVDAPTRQSKIDALESESIHKRWILRIIYQTGSDIIFEKVDQHMRPLPFMAQSLISTLFISIIPIFLIYFMSVIFMSNGTMNETFTQILLSFACGGLLGDVFFHTLPHLSEGHSHDHGHGHSHEHGHDHGHDHGHAGGHAHSVEDMLTNLIIVLGIMVFFMLEQVTQRYFSGGEGHGHSHGHVEEKDKKKGKKQDTKEEEAAKAKAIRYNSFAILSMTGDFIHNFTDGLSIGVSYVADFKMGLATTAAMFFHEIPHEVGDFAILFQNKYTLLQIVGVQIGTSLGALAGTALGTVIGQVYMKECLAFTSGGFLYFAINGLLSELKEVKTVFGMVMCMVSMASGLYFMFVFALFE